MATTDTNRLHAEYEALTERCGLVDRSERGKLALTGAGAVEFLNGQVTNELADLRPGEGRYAAFLTNKGKMLGDLRILAVGEAGRAVGEAERANGEAVGEAERADGEAVGEAGRADADSNGLLTELLLDTERVALQALFDMIRRYKIGYEVELHKRTLECGLLSLIGPDARACVASAALSEAEHAHVPAEVGGVPVRLVATHEGIDVLCEASDLDTVRTTLLEAGATAASETAAEIVRVERGRPRYGIDMDESTIPQEAGLNERAVSFTKGCYVGQETVARLHWKGKPNRYLRGLRFSTPADAAIAASAADGELAPPANAPASGEELRLGERLVGHVGSVVESPRLGAIGLALVRREASPGDTLAVGECGAAAELVELPFAP
jgi:folate-binding protein YgfZ